MAFPISGYGSLALSLKLALISTAVLLLSFAKFSFPLVTDSALLSQLPIIYASFISWLRPPYLYLIINGIIISIVASSKLHHQSTTPEISIIIPPALPPKVVAAESEYEDLNVTDTVVEDKEVIVVDADDDALSLSKLTQAQPLERSDSIEFLAERVQNKPLVSARFASKKSVKSNPEGGKAAVLGVSKPKRHDTLESTWKMITDGRPMPLARHLKKSDTWDSHGTTTPPAPPMPMKKSETFCETNNTSKLRQNSKGSGKLKKEPSLSQDELNRRVEAFIKNFNEEMRLQRQESLNQYREMVNY